MGRFYHRISDVSLPWFLGLAPCPPEEMDERESTAIRAFAPRFNTSIPSVAASKGRMPEIVGFASVFQDQLSTGGAFEERNLRRQMERAATNPAPPWWQGKQRKKTGTRPPKPELPPLEPSRPLTGEALRAAWRDYGVPSDGDPVYPVNLCDDGSVVTREGEVLGTWSMDQYAMFSFLPDGEDASLEAPLVGLLCIYVRDWYEGRTGEAL
ncbi:MAG: hypothetical protein ACU0GE_16680 [Pseudooceanicola nanhaiensis]|uniref:hypothetical protein n=1 Tax=Pseudooceanicola nanhaiensis TaxID=375761 RepID=UPI0040593D9D